jgi:hypothetical protein
MTATTARRPMAMATRLAPMDQIRVCGPEPALATASSPRTVHASLHHDFQCSPTSHRCKPGSPIRVGQCLPQSSNGQWTRISHQLQNHPSQHEQAHHQMDSILTASHRCKTDGTHRRITLATLRPQWVAPHHRPADPSGLRFLQIHTLRTPPTCPRTAGCARQVAQTLRIRYRGLHSRKFRTCQCLRFLPTTHTGRARQAGARRTCPPTRSCSLRDPQHNPRPSNETA